MEFFTFDGGRGIKGQLEDMKLDTIEDARESYASLMKSYQMGEVSENQARAMAYLFSGYLQYLKTEKDLSIEKRLAQLEEAIGGQR